jgi:uncharacterized membrane protein
VFDLISRIEEFPLYADALKEVRKIGHDTYRFVAQGGGITLEWDSVVTELKRPTRLAWRSIRGVANSGAYTLAASPAGTLVSISLQFSFPSRLVEALTAPLVIPLTRAQAAGILARVKQRLETGEHGLDVEKRTAEGIKQFHFTPKRRHTAKHV